MANWITHAWIADILLGDTELDPVGFTVGSVAPDCNIENADWTSFIPPREVTHFMTDKSKLTADCEGFFKRYIGEKQYGSNRERSFFLGYYAHLVADVEFTRFIRDPDRLTGVFARLRARPEYAEKLAGAENESYDTLKAVFGKQLISRDIESLEAEYIQSNPESGYNTVLRSIREFPDYADFLPKGAIMRKLGLMPGVSGRIPADRLFFTFEEYNGYVLRTAELISSGIERAMFAAV